MIKAVIFDLDGTIITEDHIKDGLEYTYQRNKKYLQNTSFTEFLDANDRAVQRIIGMRKNGLIELNQVGIRIWFSIFSELKIPLNAEAVYQLYKDLQNYILRNIKLKPDFIPLIKYLKRKSLKIGILSNGLFIERFERAKKVNILKYIDVLVSSDMFGIEKPDTKIFLNISELLDVSPNMSVYVGNDIHQDIEGAKSSGMIPVLLTNSKDKNQFNSESFQTVDNFSDLKILLEKLIL